MTSREHSEFHNQRIATFDSAVHVSRAEGGQGVIDRGESVLDGAPPRRLESRVVAPATFGVLLIRAVRTSSREPFHDLDHEPLE